MTTHRTDASEMFVVHRVFRRESRILRDLVAAVPHGDHARSRVVGAGVRDYHLGVHTHHTSEDEAIWPLLKARASMQVELVQRMEEQHEELAGYLDRLIEVVPGWEATADAALRDELVALFDAHRPVLITHLDEEERDIVPLICEHITLAEWEEMGRRFIAHTPKTKLLYFLGALLEEATDKERATMLGALPFPGRLVWRAVGEGHYRRRVQRLRGTTPSAAHPDRDG